MFSKLCIYCSLCLIHELIHESVNNGLEAELTTNYAYIRKFVKKIISCWDHVGLTILSAPAGNMEPCSTSCLVLSPLLLTTTATADIHCFSEKSVI